MPAFAAEPETRPPISRFCRPLSSRNDGGRISIPIWEWRTCSERNQSTRSWSGSNGSGSRCVKQSPPTPARSSSVRRLGQTNPSARPRGRPRWPRRNADGRLRTELFDHPRGGHPLFLASRRASDGFASAGEFIWEIGELRLGLCDQCIGLRGEHRLRHSLYMGTFDVGDCKSMVLQFLLDRFSSKKFCQCYHFAGVKAFGSQ